VTIDFDDKDQVHALGKSIADEAAKHWKRATKPASVPGNTAIEHVEALRRCLRRLLGLLMAREHAINPQPVRDARIDRLLSGEPGPRVTSGLNEDGDLSGLVLVSLATTLQLLRLSFADPTYLQGLVAMSDRI
jgi:hypothetical protein